MHTFPAQYSTLSSVALNDHIAAAYGLSGLFCKLLMHGVSDTYILTRDDDPAYIFKVYRHSHRDTHGIQGELELLNTLYAQGVKLAYPITDLQGQQLQHFNAAEGPRYGVLFIYAKGRTVYDFTDAQLTALGREMARFHQVSAAITLQHERETYDLQRMLLQPLQTLAPAFKDYPEGHTYLTATASQIIQKLDTLGTADFTTGYCHYDFLPKNFHFDEQDNITFFDFDFAGKGWLAHDVTSFYMHFFFHTATQKMTQPEADRAFALFLDAYRQVQPFSAAEAAAVPYLGFIFWVFYLGFQYEHKDDWSNYFFNTRYLQDRVGIIKKYISLYCPL
ncbi:phosphotransferase [Chitinophaga agrisoli]|uniref:Phosphotransferase n=1 Tax=Chitinophaga agrisoli TaxID=2607653 RepID=A0A5B2VJ03_9BACT|nr:phosphotransferase [Chitinophaga agrisoli]KAA2238884.1 phosphotransferase [Chitinophaga agrisoli]